MQEIRDQYAHEEQADDAFSRITRYILEYDEGLSGDLATITLNRPEKRNAISPEMIEDLLAAAGRGGDRGRRAWRSSPARAGRFAPAWTWSALKDAGGTTRRTKISRMRGARSSLFRRVWSFPKPLIAAVNGAALAGAAASRRSATSRWLRRRRSSVTRKCASGSCLRWWRCISSGRWEKRLPAICCLPGRVFGAREARDLGLVKRVVPAAELLSTRARSGGNSYSQ